MSLEWKDAISFLQGESERTDDSYCQLLWKRLQLGDRTTDLLQTLTAMKSLRDDSASQSPEWQAATKWLAYQRAQASNLMLDMLWAQLESGNRTPELLELIRQASHAPAPPPAPVVVVSEPPETEAPPSPNF